MNVKKGQKNPKLWLAALVATSVLTLSYKVYENYFIGSTASADSNKKRKYTNKSIALTLSHSVLNSKLPLNDILVNSENVTFILPPNLSVEDLACNIENNYNLPKTLIQNYKLLKCGNIQGYFSILKSLEPDLLLICLDDLGLPTIPQEMNRFVKEIITIDQNNEDVYSKVSPLFFK